MQIADCRLPIVSRWLAVVLIGGIACPAVTALAQEPLAWKLKPGDKLELHVEQQTSSTVTVVNKTTKTTIEMTLDSTWSVDSVENEAAKIRQTVQRVQVKVQAADAPAVAYDTAARIQPTGAARDLAAALAPLVDPESSILLTMNLQGEIASVELSPKLASAFDKSTAASQSLEALLKQPLITLPAKPVAAGESWETSRELKTPAGKFTQQTAYKLGEPNDPASTAAEITYSAMLTPVAPGTAKIKEQSHTGTVRFDNQAGRYVSGEQSQKLVTETPYREATITVVVESHVKRTLTPK